MSAKFMELHNKIELLIFDLDGTLADTVPQIALSVKRALEKNSILFPGEDRIRGFVGNGADKLLQRAMTNKFEVTDADFDPELFQLLLRFPVPDRSRLWVHQRFFRKKNRIYLCC